MKKSPALSVVAPMFNEVSVVAEFVSRTTSACLKTGLEFEIVIVDDASTDGTRNVLEERAADPRLRVIGLPRNSGQLAATREGLRRAAGAMVVVLDSDLQDPPEHVPELVAAFDQDDRERVVLAVKTARDDPRWFLLMRWAFDGVSRALGSRIPLGAGSYCLMSREMAERTASVELRNANLVAVLAALGARFSTVPYEKRARYDRRSRVGPVGLVREGLGSLALISPLGRRWLRRHTSGRA